MDTNHNIIALNLFVIKCFVWWPGGLKQTRETRNLKLMHTYNP